MKQKDNDQSYEKALIQLRKIREKRKHLNSIVKNKQQKRKVEVVEYDDGTFALNGYAYTLPLKKKDEVEEAFKAWLDGLLEKGVENG